MNNHYFIPDIFVNNVLCFCASNRDEERDKLELLKSSSSDESMRRRASSSNDSVLSGASGSTQNDSPLLGSGSSATWPAIGGLGGLGGRSPTSLITCDPPPPPLLSPTAEVLETTV